MTGCFEVQGCVPARGEILVITPILRTGIMAAILILESSPKTARQRRAVFGLQSGEFAPKGRELSALKLILRIAGIMVTSMRTFISCARIGDAV